MYLKTLITSTITVLFLAGSLFAQDITMTVKDSPQMKIDGDANVRSWDADVEKVNGTLKLTDVENFSIENLKPENIKELTLTIPVEGINSDSGRLTRNLHGYLKKDDYPEITFKLNRVTEIEIENGSARITAEGVINAAGKDHTVTMTSTASLNGDGTINFRGEQELLMTDFDIDPPTAVMGTIRARDEIVISYNVNFGR